MSIRLCAQGDILIERLEEAEASGQLLQSAHNGPVVIAEGEASGHCHRLLGLVTLYRDDAIARDIPSGLYIGHVTVRSPKAYLVHEEHAPITLDKGTYRIRRQRQLEPSEVGLPELIGIRED